MADTITTTNELKFEWQFVDGDTRTFTAKNPKPTITSAEIAELESLILNGGGSAPTLLIGDKANAEFMRINTVVKETKTTTTLDLGLEL